MANQTVNSNSNHDDLTGRLPGEDFTINNGATLTIDSMPHLTAMGILGDITISDGTLLIDGSRSFEVTYSGGSGTLPLVGDVITWNSGADTGKVIGLNSGNNISGVLTLTKDVGEVTPANADSLASGGWSATVNSVKVGFLMVFGEDQDWGSVDGRSSLRITGDWYEIGVGTGDDNQVLTLPHTGHQPAIWVETGNGTGVFEIWHRVNTTASTIFYSAVSQFGNTFESGFVYAQQFGSPIVTFGTSTNGGAPPLGARIRIPNVHVGTTTTAAPTTEVSSVTLGLHIGLIQPNTNLNVEIDHLNGSSCYVDFRGTNAVTVSDSCWGLFTTSAFINKVNATVTLTNCAIIRGAIAIAGDYLPTTILTITDNIGGITIDNCVIMAGTNENNAAALNLITMSNLVFSGRCKIVSNQQDENTMYVIRATTASNVTAETLISLGGPISISTGSNNWDINELVYGLPPARGTSEQNIINAIVHTASLNCIVRSGRLATGGAKHGIQVMFLLTDSDNVTIRNFGSVNAKIDGEARATGVVSINGITTNVLLQRLYYTNLNATLPFFGVNSSADITIENCSTDYNDEFEFPCNRVLLKGVHVASGTPDSTTGVEGDNVNVLATIFYDHFKSDTTGALGLIFNDRGVKHLSDVEITAGTPVWNGLSDLLMRTTGDQVVYTWPYLIKGHAAFQNAAIQVSAVGTYSYEYDLDTGSGFSGSWKTITGANLSAETISPAGFRFKVRITANVSNASAAIKGLAVLTETTIADQLANLYPLETVDLTLNGLKNNTEVRVYAAGTTNEIGGSENITTGSTTVTFDSGEYPSVDVSILALGYQNLRLTNVNMTGGDVLIPVQQQVDRQYWNE